LIICTSYNLNNLVITNPLFGGAGVGSSLDFSGEACLKAVRLLVIIENEKLRISNRLMKVKKNPK
jgi:hypothetical protein